MLSHPDIDLSIKNTDGCTVLHTAIFYNQAEMVSILLKYNNIDPNLKNNDGATPLHMALYNYAEKNLALHQSYMKIISSLLEHPNTRLDIVDIDGDYPLHLAAYYQNKEILALLLSDTRANVNVVNSEGYTPLEYIDHEETPKLYNWLINHYPQYYQEKNNTPSSTTSTHPGLFSDSLKRLREQSSEDDENKMHAWKTPRHE